MLRFNKEKFRKFMLKCFYEILKYIFCKSVSEKFTFFQVSEALLRVKKVSIKLYFNCFIKFTFFMSKI